MVLLIFYDKCCEVTVIILFFGVSSDDFSFLFHSSVQEYLESAGNRMTRKQLRNSIKNFRALHEEFWVSIYTVPCQKKHFVSHII